MDKSSFFSSKVVSDLKFGHFYFSWPPLTSHTTYTRNSMSQKCEGNCGLWVLNEIIKKKNILNNLKKIVGDLWELLAK